MYNMYTPGQVLSQKGQAGKVYMYGVDIPPCLTSGHIWIGNQVQIQQYNTNICYPTPV